MTQNVAVAVIQYDAKVRCARGIPAILNCRDFMHSGFQLESHGTFVGLVPELAFHLNNHIRHSFAALFGYRPTRHSSGAQENNHRRKLHPDNQADDSRQSTVHDAIWHAANVNPKSTSTSHQSSVATAAPGSTFAHAVLPEAAPRDKSPVSQHGQHIATGGKKKTFTILQNSVLATSWAIHFRRGFPSTQGWPPKQRSNRDQEQHQSTNLPVQNPNFSVSP